MKVWIVSVSDMRDYDDPHSVYDNYAAAADKAEALNILYDDYYVHINEWDVLS